MRTAVHQRTTVAYTSSTIASPAAMPEPVVLDPSGLDLPQPAADGRRQPARAVDDPVDDLGVEPPQGVGDQDAAASEDELVDVVDVVLVHAGAVHPRAEAERDALDEACRRLGVAHVPAVCQPHAEHRHQRAGAEQQAAGAEELEALVARVRRSSRAGRRHAASSAAWKTSSSQVWMTPPSGGMPSSRPGEAWSGTARMTSGATIVGALSWTWSQTAPGPRHSPQKVMKIMRNV